MKPVYKWHVDSNMITNIFPNIRCQFCGRHLKVNTLEVTFCFSNPNVNHFKYICTCDIFLLHHIVGKTNINIDFIHSKWPYFVRKTGPGQYVGLCFEILESFAEALNFT